MGDLTSENSYIDHPDFSRPGIAQQLFGEPLPPLPPAMHLSPSPDDYRNTPHAPLPLSRDEERLRFLQYNYARKRAGGAAERPLWASRAGHLREYLVRSNMALVPTAIYKRRFPGDPDAQFSEGMAALLRAVNGYDVAKGCKFSTFAVQCIFNALSAAFVQTTKRAARLPTMHLEDAGGYIAAATEADLSDDVAILRQALADNTADLTPNERYIIECRFLSGEKDTLHDIGARIGCSKERVRQIQVKALHKLRDVLAPKLACD